MAVAYTVTNGTDKLEFTPNNDGGVTVTANDNRVGEFKYGGGLFRLYFAGSQPTDSSKGFETDETGHGVVHFE